MKRLATRFYLALGLSSIVVTLSLVAAYTGLIPDPEASKRAERINLSEALAVLSTTLLEEDTPQALEQALRAVSARRSDLLTIGVRKQDKTLWLAIGAHTGWPLPSHATSTDTAIQVPLWQGTQKWGQLELQFAPLRRAGWLAYLDDPAIRLPLFLFITSFIVFSFYLGRMLRQLDPSQAIPGRVRSALDTLTEGLMVLDAKEQTVLANLSLAKIMGVEANALLGKKASTLPWTNREGQPLSKQQLPWLEALATKETRLNALMHLQITPHRRYTFRVNCSPILAVNKVQGVLISFQDITELESKEIALQHAKEEAVAANQAKSDFLANMSHEIRTPMNAILGFTELMRRHSLTPATVEGQRRHLDTIHASGQHLLALINDILDLSKVESGRLELESVRFAPHTLVHDVIEVMQVKAQEKGLVLKALLTSSLPATIQADPQRLRQILTNLVGNGIKFTETGEVSVAMQLDQTSGKPMLCIDVTDTGVGIAHNKLDAVFEPFVQAEATTNRRFGGTGLGLTISRRFARAMGGDITVSSAIGNGSTFHVQIEPGDLTQVPMLPVTSLEKPETASATLENTALWRFSPKRVLVVDDGNENRELVRFILEATGLQVDEAANGQIAVDMTKQTAFDLVLMDMQMPVMDGATATRLIRGGGQQMPILALTANAMKGFEKTLDTAGFSGFHTKPLNIDALLADLGQRLNGWQIQASTASLPLSASPRQLTQTNGQHDTTAMVSRLSQHPKLRQVVRKFIAQFPAKRQAMDEALNNQDFPALSSLAHWLKGAGGSVGFDDYFVPAKELEQACQNQEPMLAKQHLDTIRQLEKRMVLDAEDLLTQHTQQEPS